MSKRRKKDMALQLAPLVVGLAIVVAVGIFFFTMGKNSAKKEATENVATLAPETAEMLAKEADVTLEITEASESSVQEAQPAEEAYPATETKPAEEASSAWEAKPAEEAYSNEDTSDVSNDSSPYGMYAVPETWASEHGGIFVEKDGRLYSMSGYVPEENIDQFGVGYTMYGRGSGVAFLYLYDDPSGVRNEIPTKTRNALISAGDFPVLELSRGDHVIGYDGGLPLHDLSLTKVDFVGYTIEASDHSGTATMTYFPIVDYVLVSDGEPKEHVGVFDGNERSVDDVRDLTFGETYIYEWYTGSEYHEMRLTANCRCYDDSSDETVKIPYKLTKMGYSEFDLSSVAPGTYRCEGAVVKIVE